MRCCSLFVSISVQYLISKCEVQGIIELKNNKKMMIKLIQLLLIIVIFITANVLAQDKICDRDLTDPSSCSFNGIKVPDELYKLTPFKDIKFAEVKRIRFSDSRMYHLPSEVTKTYVNVQDLDISNTHISRFDGMDFSDSNILIKLNASRNAIHSLPKGLSNKFRYMQNMDISNNFIELIETGAFSYNKNLTYLNLSNNLIEVIDREFLIAVRSVKILHLSYNRISEIQGDLTDIQFDIDEIYLNDNQLKTIDPLMIKSLLVLDISRNRLEGHFNFLEAKFIELNVRANFIETLNVSTILEKLDASDSNNRMFKINFGTGSWLKELKLSNLDIVDYDHLLNQIKHLANLESLDLSHNNLESFDFEEVAKSLEVLNLERTNLRKIDNLNYVKILIPTLKEINIQDNLFDCSELPKILNDFKQHKVNVTGLIDGHLNEFVEKNCASPSHRGDHVCQTGSSGAFIFFFVVSIFGNTLCAVVFLLYKYRGFGKNPSQLLMRDF
ncbi:hypothetical protein ACKWTF_010908 [Chironomus riparius]